MMQNQTRPNDTDRVEMDSIEFSFADIHGVVNAFYTQVALDDALKVPFSSVRDWPHHIERMTHFWWLRFGGHPYLHGIYNPVAKHYAAGFNAQLLVRWLTLFKKTLAEKLTAEQAEAWGDLASRMGEALTFKNEMYAKARAGV